MTVRSQVLSGVGRVAQAELRGGHRLVQREGTHIIADGVTLRVGVSEMHVAQQLEAAVGGILALA